MKRWKYEVITRAIPAILCGGATMLLLRMDVPIWVAIVIPLGMFTAGAAIGMWSIEA